MFLLSHRHCSIVWLFECCFFSLILNKLKDQRGKGNNNRQTEQGNEIKKMLFIILKRTEKEAFGTKDYTHQKALQFYWILHYSSFDNNYSMCASLALSTSFSFLQTHAAFYFDFIHISNALQWHATLTPSIHPLEHLSFCKLSTSNSQNYFFLFSSLLLILFFSRGPYIDIIIAAFVCSLFIISALNQFVCTFFYCFVCDSFDVLPCACHFTICCSGLLLVFLFFTSFPLPIFRLDSSIVHFQTIFGKSHLLPFVRLLFLHCHISDCGTLRHIWCHFVPG